MILTQAKDAVRLFNQENAQFLKDSRKNSREEMMKFKDIELTSDQIEYSINCVKEDFDIILTPEEFKDIASLYPYEKASIVDSDRTDRESVGAIICHFFADTKMITYGDSNEDESLHKEFYKMIKDLAKYFGYKVVE